jgi:hypothetical protein
VLPEDTDHAPTFDGFFPMGSPPSSSDALLLLNYLHPSNPALSTLLSSVLSSVLYSLSSPLFSTLCPLLCSLYTTSHRSMEKQVLMVAV